MRGNRRALIHLSSNALHQVAEYVGRERGLPDDLHRQVPVTTSYPIRLKVIAVDGEHLTCLEFLGGDDEGRIGEIHRPVRISLY
jgi:hypothetical protein